MAAQMKLLKMFRVEKPKCNANKFIYFFVGVRGAGKGSWLAGYRSQQSIIVHNIDICLLMSIKQRQLSKPLDVQIGKPMGKHFNQLLDQTMVSEILFVYFNRSLSLGNKNFGQIHFELITAKSVMSKKALNYQKKQ